MESLFDKWVPEASLRPMTFFHYQPIALRVLALLCLGAGSLPAEVRLLTGNLLGKIHSGGGEVEDIAADGDLVLFTATVNPNTTTPGLPQSGLYLRSISEETLTFVGDNSVANTGVIGAEVSEDGNFITWAANNRQIYWRNLETGTTRLVTRGIDAFFSNPRLSADGRYLAFMSNARTLVADTSKLPDNGRAAVYLYDSTLSTTVLVSLSSTGGRLTGVGAGSYNDFDLSEGGRFVVFSSEDPAAHPARVGTMSNNAFAVYRRNLATGELLLLNRNSQGQVANGNFLAPRISADGSRVVFLGGGTGANGFSKMVSTLPPNGNYDVYAKDISLGTVWGLSKTTDGSAHQGLASDAPVISDSGAVVAFASGSGRLINNDDPGAVNTLSDIFRAGLSSSGTFTLSLATSSVPPGSNVTHMTGQALLTGPVIAGNGSYIAFSTVSYSTLGITGTSNLAHGVGTGIFPAPPSAGVPFFIWAFNLPFGKQGPNDNPSGDGIPNLVKFFIGSDARIPDLRHLPIRGMATGQSLGLPSDTRNYLTLTVRIRQELRTNYNWSVETSTTLTGLTTSPVPAIPVGMPTTNDGFNTYLFRFPTPVSSSERGFMRLKTSIPSEPES